MANPTIITGAVAPKRVTAQTDFSRYASDRHLLSVRAGVPVIDALNKASCFMGTAQSVATDLAMEDDASQTHFTVMYLLEQASAIVEAVIKGLAQEARKSP